MAEVSSSPLPPQVSDPAFQRRRVVNWLALGFLYASFYMSRYNFAVVMSQMAATFGWDNLRLGWFDFIMPIVYGSAVVLNGPLADRVGGRKAFLFGAVGATIANLLFGLCIVAVRAPAVMQGTGHAASVVTPAVIAMGISPERLFWMMLAVWGLNGYFQSFGALSIVKVNAQWFHVRERGTFAGIFGVLIRFGLILAFSGVPLILTVLPLAWAFWLPAAVVAVLFAVNYAVMVNTPKEAGFGAFDTGDEEEAEDDDAPVPVSYIIRKVFASRVTWTIAVSSMMIGMVRRSTIDSWWPKYFKEVHSVGAGLASSAPYQATAWGIALVGILGGFAFGISSDKIYGGRRGPVITYGFLGMIATLLAFAAADRGHAGPWTAAAFLSVLSFFINGAHGMIGGAASMDFGGRKAAATAAGLFDGVQYLASAFVGPMMGYTLDHWGWGAWHLVPIPFAVVGAGLIATIWNELPKGRKAAAPAPALKAAPEPAA